MGLVLGLVHKRQLAQNVVARLLSGAPGCAHITPMRRELHLLLISHQAMFKVLFFTDKALNNSGLCYLKDCLLLHRTVRSCRSSAEILLMALHPTEYHRAVTPKWVFSAVAPILWNAFPSATYEEAAISCLRHLVKMYLFVKLTHKT